MKTTYLYLITILLFASVVDSIGQNRYWVGTSTYLTNFGTTTELNDWDLIEDNGTGSWSLSGNGTAILQMDNAAGLFANRIFSVDGASNRFLPLDNVNGIVEFNLIAMTGGTQNFFLQVQEFNSAFTYLGEQNILAITNSSGYFSIDLSTITWNPATTQIRFMIGGSNFSAQQGTIEFDYFSYANTNKNWSNPGNWSLTPGGVGGASAPGINDTAIFNGAGGNNGICFLDAATSVGAIEMDGYTGSIDLRGNNLTVTNNLSFLTGEVTNSDVAASLVLNCIGNAVFGGSTFNVEVTGFASNIFFEWFYF